MWQFFRLFRAKKTCVTNKNTAIHWFSFTFVYTEKRITKISTVTKHQYSRIKNGLKYLCWYNDLVGYWHKYILLWILEELLLIFIQTSSMIVRYDYLEWILTYEISEGVLIQPVLILHVQTHLYMFNLVWLQYQKSQRPKKKRPNMSAYHNQLDNIKNGNVTYYKQQIEQYLGEYCISTLSIGHGKIIKIYEHIFLCQDQCKYRNVCHNNTRSNYCQQTSTMWSW